MTTPDEGVPAALVALRRELEQLDGQLIRLLAERERLAREIGAAKRAAGIPTLDPAREAAVVRRAAALAREHGLDEEVVRAVFWKLIASARRAQHGP
ncbi:MAG: chorismate mutase [Candidatus Cloacimonetes bacterium]|nr:chorismate mutase [Candidatus Cloacimonadota bacterium]